MSAELVKNLVPFGIAGLAIVAILLIVFRPQVRWLAVVAMLLIVAIFAVDRLNPPQPLSPAGENGGAKPPPPGISENYWVDTATKADWGGRDYAYTSSQVPKYSVKARTLCDENHIGYIATCWEYRPTGYPPGITDTDVQGARPDWCTYKDSSVTLATPPDGKASPGRVYLCGRAIKR